MWEYSSPLGNIIHVTLILMTKRQKGIGLLDSSRYSRVLTNPDKNQLITPTICLVYKKTFNIISGCVLSSTYCLKNLMSRLLNIKIISQKFKQVSNLKFVKGLIIFETLVLDGLIVLGGFPS